MRLPAFRFGLFADLRFLQWVLLCVGIFLSGYARATHQKAAEITYKHISGYTYQVKITTFTYTESLADRAELTLSWGDNTSSVLPRSKEIIYPNEFTKENHYYGTHTYPGPGQYFVSMEDNDRNGGIVNIPNSINTYIFVDALIWVSPFIDPPNSSPILLNKPIDKGCLGQVYMHNAGAADIDGDSLSYKLINCRGAGGEDIPGFYLPHASNFVSINEKTGDFTWDSPIEQGEFNIAILIEEWRSGVKIGELTRDMQITIQACDNRPPHIIVDEEFCVEAGKTIEIEMDAIDIDGDYIRLFATGGVFEDGVSNSGKDLPLDSDGKASFSYALAKDSVHGILTWNTLYKHAQLNSYPVYLRAQDNGTPPLIDLKTIMIKVIAPASQFVNVEPTSSSIALTWNKNLTPKIYGYNLYRSQGDFSQDVLGCKTGVIDSSFVKIATFSAPTDTFYIDADSQLAQGMQYIYQLEGLLRDGAKTYPSQKVVTKLINTAPIITKVDVLSTDLQAGQVQVDWLPPKSIEFSLGDTLEFEIWRGLNLKEQLKIDSFFVKDSFELLYSYIDSQINTDEKNYYYRIYVNRIKNGSRIFIASSKAASTLYLQSFPKNRGTYLSWNYDHPWMNHTFVLYRADAVDGPYDSITTLNTLNYWDKGLENGQSYFYYVRSYGSYYSSDVPFVLVNNSNSTEVVPQVFPPCPPNVKTKLLRCDPMETLVEWSFSDSECESDIKEYLLYYKSGRHGDFNLVEITTDTKFNHLDVDSYFGCYAVKTVNTEDMESELSTVVCTDHRTCFRYKLPNVFTPNGDGVNDYFKAFPNQYVQKLSISIYDRWGKLVFSSQDPQFEWDGKYIQNGRMCPNGAYFYVVEFESGEPGIDFELTQTGSITLLR